MNTITETHAARPNFTRDVAHPDTTTSDPSLDNPRDLVTLPYKSAWVFVPEITRDCAVTDRTLRKWISQSRFPQPDGNLHGRCFWRRDTYRSWQSQVLSGLYAKSSNLCM